MNGEQALAYGGLAAGVAIVASYPGSPGSGTVETLIDLAKHHAIYVEWSSNERVALEIAIGASIAGRCALVCAKSVGMNVMLDPLMALNFTPVNGGLVILLGDDPGAYGSQNDQDTRQLAPMLEIPILEPSTPAEAFDMMREVFAASERLKTPFIIRITRSFAQQQEPIEITEVPNAVANIGLAREKWRFVPVPKNAVEKQAALHERMEAARDWQEKLLFIFVAKCREILIFEEIEPFVENQIKAIAHDNSLSCKISGKQSGHVSREGELFRWQIQEVLSRFIPNFVPANYYSREQESLEFPKKKSYCSNCRYGEVLDILESAATELQQMPVLIGDPGCLLTIADRLDAKYAIGSAVGVADGISKAGAGERAIAIFGDSSFFHSTLPAICNSVHNHSNIIMVVLDNHSTMTSGLQPNPGTGKNALGRKAPNLICH
ncbi:MAG: thiamine pyrophosphate-dependent enzyme [bacterium]